MACVLGCVDQYKVYIADRGGAPHLSQAPLPVRVGRWSRILDDISDARVTLDIGMAPECCGLLKDVRTWRHELVIYRDEERVWEGPITQITAGRETVILDARDVGVWMGRRVINGDLTLSGDLSQVGALLVDNAYNRDDPNVLTYVEVRDAGVDGARTYETRSAYVLDALKELAKTAIDFTVIGRKIVIGGPLTFGQLTQLTCDHFTGDLAVIEDGLAAATAAVVKGDGVVGTAGGEDGYFGLIEAFAKDDAIKDQASADYAAEQLLSGANPPPLFIAPGTGSSLTSTAPVCVEELVPGVLVPMRVDCTCRQAQQMMRLVGLTVDWDTDGETVRPLLETPGAFT